MKHSQECLKGWLNSEKNPRVILTVYVNKKAKNLGRFVTEERANQEILKFNNQ